MWTFPHRSQFRLMRKLSAELRGMVWIPYRVLRRKFTDFNCKNQSVES